MPTYAFRCSQCGHTVEPVLSISEYVRNPPALYCCRVQMQRYFQVVPGLAIHNALAGDRHYQGLCATDGTDVGSRSKHRAYMRERGLTTVDDYTQTWARQAEERKARLAGEDRSRVHDVAEAITQLEQRS
jgi:hypothetical protein